MAVAVAGVGGVQLGKVRVLAQRVLIRTLFQLGKGVGKGGIEHGKWSRPAAAQCARWARQKRQVGGAIHAQAEHGCTGG